jgi:hypothetical protein
VFATVKNSHFSGHGHRLGNLLPCCKSCNSAKGNKEWRDFLASLNQSNGNNKAAHIENFLTKYSVADSIPTHSKEYEQLLHIKQQVMELLTEADQLAQTIREQTIASATTPPSEM